MCRPTLTALAILVLAAAACNKDNTTTTGPDPAVCRNYLSNFTETTTLTQTGNSSMRTYSCTYNTATHALACTSSRNGVGCETNTKQYASTADFVDEVSVNPPRQLFQTETWANISSCGGNPNVTSTYTYDAQKRVTSGTSSQGASANFTAWDAAGRPTAGTASDGANNTYTYDSSTRTRVQTVTGPRSATVTTVYDANGNVTSTNSTSNGGVSTTFSGSTSQVCK
jgi:YD repeat-containing protein